jgi:hypothetical protein
MALVVEGHQNKKLASEYAFKLIQGTNPALLGSQFRSNQQEVIFQSVASRSDVPLEPEDEISTRVTANPGLPAQDPKEAEERPKIPRRFHLLRRRHDTSLENDLSHAKPRDHAVAMDLDESNDDGYVYDTYVRHFLNPVDKIGSTQNVSSNTGIGFLVIDEESQPLWEEFLNDEESDEEGLDDDEDSNGDCSFA